MKFLFGFNQKMIYDIVIFCVLLVLKPGQIRCGEHTDYGTITLLFQDTVGGLEVKVHCLFCNIKSLKLFIQ